MACNFKISVEKKSKNLHLKLAGDFDGSSALQLIHSLKTKRGGVSRAFIHTSCLRDIYPFGRDVFESNLRALSGKTIPIVFTGEKANLLAPKNNGLNCSVS